MPAPTADLSAHQRGHGDPGRGGQLAGKSREEIVAERVAETGIDETMIRRLVHRFYGDVRADPVLGPVFEAKVDDWPAHLAKLCDFWSSIALMTGRFSGRPMQAHALLPIDEPHFRRWLELFARAAADVCPRSAALFFVGRAEMIAHSLQLGLDWARGRPVPGA